MSGIPIDDIHRLLDMLDGVFDEIEKRPTNSIQVVTLPELSEVILEVLDWTNTAYIENRLGVNPALLSKFVKMRGVVSKNNAWKLAGRLRTFLRSEDQAFNFENPAIGKPSSRPSITPSTPAVVIPAEQWLAVAITSETKAKIAVISGLLDSVIAQVSRANAPEDEQILTKIERQQLIAILETALNVLKSPLVEKGLLKKAGEALKKGANSVIEKSVQQGLATLMTEAGHRLLDLLKTLSGG